MKIIEMPFVLILCISLPAALGAGCSGCVTPASPDGGPGPTPSPGDDGGTVAEPEADAGPVDLPPVVTIDSPADAAVVAIGESISFTATVSDPEDGDVPNEEVRWNSDLDGAIGVGVDVVNALVTVGEHTISCAATDATGHVGTATITLDVVDNFVPEVTILSPATDSFHASGEPITFEGSATDVEDGILTGVSMSWWLRGTQLGSGATLTTALANGAHTVELHAEDSEGAVGTAIVELQVVDNLPPRCTITSPADDATIEVGATTTFSASCVDPDGVGPIANGDIFWTSDVDGDLGLGTSVQNALVSAGDHVVSVCAPDTEDAALIGCARIDVTAIVNQPPVVEMASPAFGAVLPACTPVELACTATDPEGGAVTVSWSSSASGAIGDGPTLSWTPLASGIQTLTCTALDATGNAASMSVDVEVTSPSVAITAPENNAVVAFQRALLLTGGGCDVEDGDLVGPALEWSSSVDGLLGIGASLELSTLTAGTHTITLTGTDSAANSAATSVQVVVNAAPVVEISSPTAASVFDAPVSIDLAGTAIDAEDGALVPSWSVDGIGELGTGNTLSWASPPPGVFPIRLRATDSHGTSRQASVSIRINGPDPLVETVVGPTGSVDATFIDRVSGRVWLSTSVGLYGYDPVDDIWELWTSFSDGDTPPINATNMNAVSVDSNGDLLIADDQGFAVGCDATATPPTMTCDVVAREPRPEDVFEMDDSRIRATLSLPGGRVLIGGECLLFANVVQGQLEDDRAFCEGDGGGDGLISRRIQDLAFDEGRGGVWVATDDGVSLMTLGNNNQGNGTTFTDYDDNDGLASNDVRAVQVAPSGDVYFATDNGVSILSVLDDTFTSIRADNGLPSSDCRDLDLDLVDLGQGQREVAWVATSGGLGRIDNGLGTVQALTVDDGLPTDDCRSVAVDADHSKWVGTNTGVFQYRGH